MNHHTSDPLLDANAINERSAAAVGFHKLKIRVLIALAVVFGFLALATSIGLAWSYFIFVLPRQTQLMEGMQNFAQPSGTNTVVEPANPQEAMKQVDRLLRMEAEVSRVMGLGTSVLAMAVGALGLGALVLLLVVILNRRVGLNHLNASLAEISNQLRELHRIRSNPPTSTQ